MISCWWQAIWKPISRKNRKIQDNWQLLKKIKPVNWQSPIIIGTLYPVDSILYQEFFLELSTSKYWIHCRCILCRRHLLTYSPQSLQSGNGCKNLVHFQPDTISRSVIVLERSLVHIKFQLGTKSGYSATKQVENSKPCLDRF